GPRAPAGPAPAPGWAGRPACAATRSSGGAAAGQVGAADAARKEGVPGEKILPAQQADAAGGVAGGVPRGELHLVHLDHAPLLIAAVRRLQREELPAAEVGLFAPELGVPLLFQFGGAAHMVEVAVGAEDIGEG